jgi:hypothetical protein
MPNEPMQTKAIASELPKIAKETGGGNVKANA